MRPGSLGSQAPRPRSRRASASRAPLASTLERAAPADAARSEPIKNAGPLVFFFLGAAERGIARSRSHLALTPPSTHARRLMQYVYRAQVPPRDEWREKKRGRRRAPSVPKWAPALRALRAQRSRRLRFAESARSQLAIWVQTERAASRSRAKAPKLSRRCKKAADSLSKVGGALQASSRKAARRVASSFQHVSLLGALQRLRPCLPARGGAPARSISLLPLSLLPRAAKTCGQTDIQQCSTR